MTKANVEKKEKKKEKENKHQKHNHTLKLTITKKTK